MTGMRSDTLAPTRTVAGLEVLAAAIGADCAPTGEVGPSVDARSTIVVLPGGPAIRAADAERLRRRAAAGGTVVLAVGAGTVLPFGVEVADRTLTAPAAHDPIVLDPHLVAHGRGPFTGLRLEADDLVAIDVAGGEPLFELDGRVVAAWAPCGAGTLCVIGSTAFLRDHWLAAADNAAIAARLAAGRAGAHDPSVVATAHAAATLVARHRPSGPRAHAPVPVITSQPGEWADLVAHPPALPLDDPRLVRAAGHARRLLPAAVHDALVDSPTTPVRSAPASCAAFPPARCRPRRAIPPTGRPRAA
ncbi:MAG: hypothetical protein JWM05_1559 [Acidimicrobiales bacterium]|nr:hypothetical protein [Acidimicrobiales bacterium]